jgi:hypothetical protein
MQVDQDDTANGVHWATIGRLDGVHAGTGMKVMVDPSQPAAVFEGSRSCSNPRLCRRLAGAARGSAVIGLVTRRLRTEASCDGQFPMIEHTRQLATLRLIGVHALETAYVRVLANDRFGFQPVQQLPQNSN